MYYQEELMKKAVAVMVVLSAIIVLSFSSSHAACSGQPGKITKMVPASYGSTSVVVHILQTGTTNKYWMGSMPLTSPFVQFFTAAMAGGLTVRIYSGAPVCPAPFQTMTGGTVGTAVDVGTITHFILEK